MFMFPERDVDRLMLLWREYVGGVLGSKAQGQFERATRKPSMWLANRIIKPRLFLPDAFGGIYYPVDVTKFSAGRNHRFAEIISGNPDLCRTYGCDPWIGLMLFANPLQIETEIANVVDEDFDRVGASLAPKDRVALGDYHILTYEFDIADLGFLEFQLSLLRSSKNKLDCAMGDLFRYCSAFSDFEGITVNYSGNKSLHIHIVFSTEIARDRLKLDRCIATDLRRGFASHWEHLHQDVLRILGVHEHQADTHLRFAESYRRVPNGSRVVEKGHLLGIPEGEIIPQLTLWEQSRSRASGDELPLFWQPDLFQKAQAPSRPFRAHQPYVADRRVGPNLTPSERDYCEERLRERYPDWPRFEHLSYERGRWVAKFKNSPSDQKPSSTMREDFNAILLMGRDSADLRPRRLPFPLGDMIRVWQAQFAQRAGCDDVDVVDLDDILLTPAGAADVHPLEMRFRANVCDGGSARSEMRSMLRETVMSTPLLLVSGPEGVGKTSTVMCLHDEIMSDLDRRGESTLSMYAFADYEAADAKCAAFNAMQGANGYVGVVLPSFSRAYEQECEKLEITAISTEDAARRGYRSRWSAIEALQPEVMVGFREQHAALWARIGLEQPVFFVVHQVAHNWVLNTPSRLMWAPSFWSLDCDVEGRNTVLRRETTLGLLVHDEIKTASLVEVRREEVVGWVEALADSDPDLWYSKHRSLPALVASYDKFVAAQRWPAAAASRGTLGFEEAQRLANDSLRIWDHVVTRDTGEYGCRAPSTTQGEVEGAEEEQAHRDIYAARHGRDWMIRSQGWWHNVADRVVLLTTEALPTAVARKADSSFVVYDLEAPLARRDQVDVYPSRFVRGDNLADLCQAFRDARPKGEDWQIISNKVSMLSDTLTHASARGSNALIGRNVVQTMTWMTPDEYEMLQALNAWTGRRDLVGLRHVDEFNQSAGRNLGFRHRGDAKHALLINLRLLDTLLEHRAGVLGRARYGLRLRLNKSQRYESSGRKVAGKTV